MEKTKDQEHDARTAPTQSAASSEQAQPAETEATTPETEVAVSGDEAPTLESLATSIARLSAEMRQQKMAFQDSEVALVTRIADVDDDRRQAATRLQRTLQAQREELDTRFKRQAALFIWLVLIFVLLLGGALGLAYLQFKDMRNALASEIDGLRRALEAVEIPETTATDPRAREKLGALSKAVDEISESLARIGGASSEAPRADAPAPSQPATPEPEPEPKSAAPKVEEPAPEARAPAPPAASQAETNESKPLATETKSAEESAESDPATTPPEAFAGDTKPASPETSAVVTPPLLPGQLAQQTVDPAPEDKVETPATPESFKVGDRRFSVQLMGFFSLDSLGKFAKERNLPAEIYYQTTTYQGRPWYVLIHSLHSSQADADAAVAALPKELGKLDIWVRQLDAQKEISRFIPAAD